jgi:hypothetical protein
MAMKVPIIRILETLEEIEVKHRKQFFTKDHILLSHPSLWIFDCRHCLTVREDAEWTVEDYKKCLSIVQQWINQIS